VQFALFCYGAKDLEEATGHPIGGVCPFDLIKPLDIYLG